MLHSTAEPAQRPFRISAFPPGVTRQGNPYFMLCHAALAKRGISVSDDLEIDLRWLEARAGSIDAVHLHWPERFWGRGPFGRLSRVRRGVLACERLLLLVRFVRAARRFGMSCLWTVHNMEPHEGAYRWDHYGYRLLASECDLVICHSHSAARAVRHTYRPRGRVVVMPIGDPAAVQPPARPRTEVLAGLRLDPQRPVVACFGWLRQYKGLDLACAAIERLNGRVQLIIGGPCHAEFDVANILAMIERLPGAVLIDRQLTDQEFADLTAASDVVLLPYRAITGSSALLAALGAGRGVVTSDLPYFHEILADEPDAGATVSDWDAAAWAIAIIQYLERPGEVRRGAALRLAARYSWDRCVEPLVAALTDQQPAGIARMQMVEGLIARKRGSGAGRMDPASDRAGVWGGAPR
jgi:beta-1,4-mannosyltransferase